MSDETADLLAQLSHRVKTRLKDPRVLDAMGLTPFQAEVLVFFGRHAGAGQQALAARSGRDKAQVARVIKELEMRGLLRRQADPADGRAFCIHPTEAGTALIARLLERRAAIAAAMMQGIAAAEEKTLACLLQRMYRNLSELPEK